MSETDTIRESRLDTHHYQQLKEKLQELFQMDHADLDFGIYRIMNTKREEITRYLDNDLLVQIENSLTPLITGRTVEIKKQMREIEQNAREFNADPQKNSLYRNLAKQLSDNVDVASTEKEIFSDLYAFFSRYYEDGDFLSRRRYKEGVYAIPYAGEEVKLHWANSDQYYIKTAEHFTNYRFHLTGSGKIVRFCIENGSTEQNNNKEGEGKERRFLLLEKSPEKTPVIFGEDELIVRFEYKQDKEKRKQIEINASIVALLREEIQLDEFAELFECEDKDGDKDKDKDNGKSTDKCLLERHLYRYTARNQFDYFIHKDLGGFLRRELDFFLKNEVLILDDVLAGDDGMVTRRFIKLRVMKQIAEKIIRFLAQLEDFQKKLWLKKKFVVETNWCVTLDRVSEEFYDEIMANEAQREEWVKLFAIDEIKNDLSGEVEYSTPLTKDFLRANPFLVLDTAFFTEDFKQRLVASLEDLDEQTDGLLIHSENFQALNLLQEKYQESIKCVYIDPPYNTNAAPIIYKNSYRHSSWLSLMLDRMILSKMLQPSDKGVMSISIDENEMDRFSLALDNLYSECKKVAVSVVHNPRGRRGNDLSICHEFLYFLFPEGMKLPQKKLTEKKVKPLMKTGQESERGTAKNCFYPIIINREGKFLSIGNVSDKNFHPESSQIDKGDTIELYPISSEGKERKWRYAYNSFKEIQGNISIKKTSTNGNWVVSLYKEKEAYKTVWSDAKYNAAEYGSTLLKNIIDTNFSFPKSVYTIEDVLRIGSEFDSVILDYFAGSATTGHAVLNLNREDGGTRKYILVEMGEYFNSVTKPRMQKVVYSKDWKEGKPVSRQGSSHCFKYIRLESYEDTLNNLTLKRDDIMDSMFEKDKQLHEQYLLSYMLEIESQESLLSLSEFDKPFDCQLEITRNSKTSKTTIDMVETFNYLIGLVVSHQSSVHRFDAEFSHNTDGKLTLKGPLKKSQNGKFAFRAVKGKTRTDKQVLAIWRERNPAVKDTTDETIEEDDVVLRVFLRTLPQDELQNYDIIYVNGDNTLMNIRENTEHWQTHLIEEAFHRLMFSQPAR